MSTILRIKNLYKTLNVDGTDIQVLKNINLDIEEGEFIEDCLSRKKNVVPIIMDAIGE